MLCFFKSQSFRGSSPDSFTSCEIYENKPCLNLFDSIWYSIRLFLVLSTLINIDMKHGMTSARSFIHFLWCHFTILHSSIYNIDCLIYRIYGHFDKVFYEYFSIVFFSDLQVLSFMRIQEVLNLVLIDLVKTYMNFPLKKRTSLFLFLEYFKNTIHRLWNNSLTVHINIVENSHCVCLTCSCLSIDKVRSIITIKYIVHQR